MHQSGYSSLPQKFDVYHKILKLRAIQKISISSIINTYLLSPLITIEDAENRQCPFSSDLKLNKIILNYYKHYTWAMMTLRTNFSNYFSLF